MGTLDIAIVGFVFKLFIPDLEFKTTVCVSNYHHELSIGHREQPVANMCM